MQSLDNDANLNAIAIFCFKIEYYFGNVALFSDLRKSVLFNSMPNDLGVMIYTFYTIYIFSYTGWLGCVKLPPGIFL